MGRRRRHKLLWTKGSYRVTARHLSRGLLLGGSIFHACHLVRCHQVLQRRYCLLRTLIAQGEASFISLALEKRGLRLTLIAMCRVQWLRLMHSLVWRLGIDARMFCKVFLLYFDLLSCAMDHLLSFEIRVVIHGCVATWAFQPTVPCFIGHQALLGRSR